MSSSKNPSSSHSGYFFGLSTNNIHTHDPGLPAPTTNNEYAAHAQFVSLLLRRRGGKKKYAPQSPSARRHGRHAVGRLRAKCACRAPAYCASLALPSNECLARAAQPLSRMGGAVVADGYERGPNVEMAKNLTADGRRVTQRSAIRYLTPSPGGGWIIGVSRESPYHFFSEISRNINMEKKQKRKVFSISCSGSRRHGGHLNVLLRSYPSATTQPHKQGRCGCKIICVGRT